MVFVACPDVVKVSIEFRDVFFILFLQPVDCFKELDLVFSLDHKYLVLESLDVSLEGILGCLVFFDLSLISLEEEGDFRIFLLDGFVEIADF